MNYFLPFIIGFLVGFIGLLAPSMLNMTAARISIEKGKKEAFQFSSGASLIVFIQGFIAVTFAKYLIANQEIIIKLKTAAIFILISLSIYFFYQTQKKFKTINKNKKGSSFFIGLAMSSLNMLAIPFYLAMATLAENKGWITIEQPFSLIYVTGAVLGSFSIFISYASFAVIISRKVEFIAKNINYILSALFLVLAISTAIQVFG